MGIEKKDEKACNLLIELVGPRGLEPRTDGL